MNAIAEPLKFRGSSSRYIDIGVRGDDFLAASVEYAVHPSNIGCFIVRFVAHGKSLDPLSFKHLTYREEKAQFLIPASKDNPSNEVFNGIRLNKLALPAFKPAIKPYEVADKGTEFGLFLVVADWIGQQAQLDGFTLLTEASALAAEFRNFFTLPPTEGTIENILELPDLTTAENKKAALKLVQKPEPEEDTEDEDGDEDEDKEWLN